MSGDLISYPKMDNQMTIQEAASQCLKSMEHMIRLLSHQSNHHQCTDAADLTVSKFKRLISLINRTGHARFRRGSIQSSFSSSPPSLTVPNSHKNLSLTPVPIATPATTNSASSSAPVSFFPSQAPCLSLDSASTSFLSSNNKNNKLEFTKESLSVSSDFLFMSSAITGDGIVSNGKKASSPLLKPSRASSAGKPPLSSAPYKKRCHEHEYSNTIERNLSESGNGKFHCTKKRKNRMKKVIRVPAISSKIADIPSDEYSWRKYGQKPIKGSPYPR